MRQRIVHRALVGAVSVTAIAALAACGSTAAKPTVTVAPKVSTVTTVVATKPSPTTAKSGTTAAATKPATTVVATTVKAGTATTAKAGTSAATYNVNTATDADLAKIPGITTQAITAIKAGRPFANVDAFRTAMTKTIAGPLETAIEKYLAF